MEWLFSSVCSILKHSRRYLTILPQFAIVGKSSYHAARINVSRNAFMNSRSEEKHIFFDVHTILWRTIGATIQLLNFACTFGIRYCSFTICTYICNSTFKFPISLLQLTIWRCLFHNSTSKFTQFNIQVYAIQHPRLRNSTSKFTQFNIQLWKYPTAIRSMTVRVGSENYQNSPCVGANKGRSRYPRQ